MLGEILGFLGGQSTNSANAAINSTNNAFNAEQAQVNRSWSADQAQKQMDYQSEMANTSWQRGVKDMQAAGLSPMLAYSKGGAIAPTGSMGSSSAASAAAPIAMGNSFQAAAQLANTNSDTANKLASAMVSRGEAANKQAQGEQSWASAFQSRAAGALSEQMSRKVNAEVANIASEGERIRAATVQLAEQAKLMIQQGKTQQFVRDQLEAVVSKLRAETRLIDFDVKAADQLGNFGREAGQLKPFIDMVMGIFRSMRR